MKLSDQQKKNRRRTEEDYENNYDEHFENYFKMNSSFIELILFMYCIYVMFFVGVIVLYMNVNCGDFQSSEGVVRGSLI